MHDLDSSVLSLIEYDEERRALTAVFRESGRAYVYEAVPLEEYESMLCASSVGAYFNKHIRDCYPCREIVNVTHAARGRRSSRDARNGRAHKPSRAR